MIFTEQQLLDAAIAASAALTEHCTQAGLVVCIEVRSNNGWKVEGTSSCSIYPEKVTS